MTRREVPFPSFIPGWALIAALVISASISWHLVFTAFAHQALGHPGPMIGHVLTGEGWQAVRALTRCSLTVTFSGLSTTVRHGRPSAFQQWCHRVWDAFEIWSQGQGTTWFGFTIVFVSASAAGAYIFTLRRFVPRGLGRRRSATFATREELREFTGRASQRLREGALPLGEAVHEAARGVQLWLPLKYRPQHVWVLGVTGAGKSSAAIKRWVAADAVHDGVATPLRMSTVAVDVKDPDLWNFIAPVGMQYARRVLRWAPMSPDSMSHNFLDYVRTPQDALEIAEVVLSNDPQSKRKDPFWIGTERNVAQMTLFMLCTEPEEVLRQPWLEEKMADVLGTVPPPRSIPFFLGLTHLNAREFQDYVIKIDGPREVWRNRFSTAFAQGHDKLAGALLGIQNVLISFRDPTVIAATTRSDFNLRWVAEQPTTLVIGLPREPGHQRQILTALFIRQLLSVFAAVGAESEGHVLPVPVTMLLDELGALGYIPTLPDVVATYRDLGVSFVIATQDRAQLRDVYREDQADVLLANLRTRVVFGRDLRPEQADEICSALGEVVVAEPQVGFEHRGPFRVRKSMSRVGYQLRRLVEPNELRAMDEFHTAVVLPGDLKVHAVLPPVHTDAQFAAADATRTVDPLAVLRHEVAMDRVLGRRSPLLTPAAAGGASAGYPGATGRLLRATPDIRTARPAAQPPYGTPDSKDSPHPPPGTTGPREVFRSVPVEQAASLESRSASSSKTAPPAEPPGPSGSDLAAMAPAGRQTAPAGSLLVEFLSTVVVGRLRDERLPNGSQRGWVVDDASADLVVPWGFLRDWGYRAKQRFMDAERKWRADGMLRGRATVMVAGKAVTCLIFPRTVLQELPGGVAKRISQEFQPLSRTDLKLSGGVPKKPTGWGPDLPEPALSAPPSADIPAATPPSTPPPFLSEFMAAVCAQGASFMGHPTYDPTVPFQGRWVFKPRDDGALLLVEREASVRILAEVGVVDPPVTLQIWKDAGVLYLDEDPRGEFYIRRRGSDGTAMREFLGLLWSALRQWNLVPANMRPGVM